MAIKKARVLVDGTYGKVNDVVEVDEKELPNNGELDGNPLAVKYAESLKKQAKKDE